jgi:hypothetical protein
MTKSCERKGGERGVDEWVRERKRDTTVSGVVSAGEWGFRP